MKPTKTKPEHLWLLQPMIYIAGLAVMLLMLNASRLATAEADLGECLAQADSPQAEYLDHFARQNGTGLSPVKRPAPLITDEYFWRHPNGPLS